MTIRAHLGIHRGLQEAAARHQRAPNQEGDRGEGAQEEAHGQENGARQEEGRGRHGERRHVGAGEGAADQTVSDILQQ